MWPAKGIGARSDAAPGLGTQKIAFGYTKPYIVRMGFFTRPVFVCTHGSSVTPVTSRAFITLKIFQTQTYAKHVTHDDLNGHDVQPTHSYRDEIYSRRVPAGKRTYYFDVKTTRSGEDFFVTITESKRIGENRHEKHKVFLYKEDFGKFITALHDVIKHVVDERLPGYEFRNLPELTGIEDREYSPDDSDYR